MKTQPVPSITAADVDRIVRRDFPHDRFPEALSMLAEYGPESWHREVDRVRLAILKLAGGNVEKLRQEIEVAKRDYRDVLAPAEYPNHGKYPLGVNKLPPEEQRCIIESDWRQYQDWLRK